MKSINKKAEKLTEKRVELSREESITYFQGIEAGANYVLEKFVDIVNKNTKPNGMQDRAQMASDMLILIAQLKK